MLKKSMLIILVFVFHSEMLKAQVPTDEELLNLALEQYVFSKNYIQDFVKNYNHTELIQDMIANYDTVYVIDLKEPKDSLNWIDKSKIIVYVDDNWIEERGLLYTKYGERQDRLLFTGCLLYRLRNSVFFGIRSYTQNTILKQISDYSWNKGFGKGMPNFIRYFNNYYGFTLSISGRNWKRLYFNYKLKLTKYTCYVNVRLDLTNSNFLNPTETVVSFSWFQKHVYLYTRKNRLVAYRVCNFHEKCSKRRLKPIKKYRKLNLKDGNQFEKPVLVPYVL